MKSINNFIFLLMISFQMTKLSYNHMFSVIDVKKLYETYTTHELETFFKPQFGKLSCPLDVPDPSYSFERSYKVNKTKFKEAYSKIWPNKGKILSIKTGVGSVFRKDFQLNNILIVVAELENNNFLEVWYYPDGATIYSFIINGLEERIRLDSNYSFGLQEELYKAYGGDYVMSACYGLEIDPVQDLVCIENGSTCLFLKRKPEKYLNCNKYCKKLKNGFCGGAYKTDPKRLCQKLYLIKPVDCKSYGFDIFCECRKLALNNDKGVCGINFQMFRHVEIKDKKKYFLIGQKVSNFTCAKFHYKVQGNLTCVNSELFYYEREKKPSLYIDANKITEKYLCRPYGTCEMPKYWDKGHFNKFKFFYYENMIDYFTCDEGKLNVEEMFCYEKGISFKYKGGLKKQNETNLKGFVCVK